MSSCRTNIEDYYYDQICGEYIVSNKKSYDYENNPYFDRIVLEVKPDMQKIIKKKALESIVSEEEFQVLKGIETYDKAIMEAKSALERM